ncbi:hypothetical protein M5689_023768 [Euphorbia peplus]|nr:hypothetical protein M5689_023768 [Euphorbia peplus]
MQNSCHHSKVKQNKKKWGKFRWVFFSIFSRKNGSTDHQLKRVESDWIKNESSAAIPPDSPLYDSYSFLKLLKIEDEQQKKAKTLRPNKADTSIKMVSFSKFLLLKPFIKTKSSNITENKSIGNNVDRIAEVVIGRQASGNSRVCRVASIGRTPSRIGSPSPSQRLKMAHSLTKMTSRGRSMARRDDSEGRGSEELCKKRILMGGKCKPLMGGILQYDRDGVLKPDLRV